MLQSHVQDTDGRTSTMMDIMLEINQRPGLPTILRYDVSVAQDELHARIQPTQSVVKTGIKPDEANLLMQRYKDAVQDGVLPSFELYFVREQIQDRLAEQGVRQLAEMERHVRMVDRQDASNNAKYVQLQHDLEQHRSQAEPDSDPSFMTGEYEDTYLARLDAKLNGREQIFNRPESRSIHQAELTPRESERQLELLNPQSQHSWLRAHPRSSAVNVEELGDEITTKTGGARKRASLKGALVKNVGDRMLRDGQSPSEASGFGYDDELAADEYQASSNRKKVVDKDPTFRGKISKGGSTKAKRKRATDDSQGGSKRIRAADAFD